MFWFTRKPSSGSHSQYLAKITRLVQCVTLAKYWMWLPDDGFLVNWNLLEQLPYFKMF